MNSSPFSVGWATAFILVKTVATILAAGVALSLGLLTGYWRGWCLVTVGLVIAPLIGIFQIFGLYNIPAPHYWDWWTGVVLPFLSMVFVSWGVLMIRSQVKAALKGQTSPKTSPKKR